MFVKYAITLKFVKNLFVIRNCILSVYRQYNITHLFRIFVRIVFLMEISEDAKFILLSVKYFLFSWDVKMKGNWFIKGKDLVKVSAATKKNKTKKENMTKTEWNSGIICFFKNCLLNCLNYQNTFKCKYW